MITREFNLYLHAGHSIPLVINANQYDHGEQWLFTLFNSDGTQYVPSSGAIVGIKSDNLGIINSGSVDGQGRVVINETQQMTAAVGKAVFELVIDDGTHGTANFVVLVEAKPGDNADLSESDISMIEEAVEAAANIKPYGSPLVASTVAGMTDHEKVYVYVGSETGYTSGNWYYWDGSAWTSGGVYNSVAVQTDTTLTLSGVAADAKKAGDEISDLKSQIEQSGGLTSAIKSALLQIAQKVAYIDDDGQTYYDDLYDALYPPIVVTAITLSANSLSFGTLNSTQQLTATTTPTGGAVTWSSSDTSVATVSATGLVTAIGYGNATITATSGSLSATCSVAIAQATVTSISASYTQSGDVYTDTSLADLKTDLVVTASWSNGGTSTVPSTDYTLSGTLTVGTSAVTVEYGGQTTTFNVAVTAKVVDGAYAIWDARDYTVGNSWTDRIGGIALTPTGSPTKSGNAVVFDGTAKYFSVGNLSIPTGPEVVTIQVAFKVTDLTKPSFVLVDDKTSSSRFSLALRPGDDAIRTSVLNGINKTFEFPYTFDTEWHLLTAKLGNASKLVYIDNTLIGTQSDDNNLGVANALNSATNLHVGAYSVYNSYANAQIRSIYIYAKSLSDSDIANNYSVESLLWE